MPSKGLRFFGTDYAALAFGGSPTASSSIANSQFVFDGLTGTKWISSGENTDGNDVFVEMDYGFGREIDSFFVYDTNIEDVEVQYFVSPSWITASASNATIVKSLDLMHMFVKLNAAVTATKVRVAGGDTITPNQEKYVTQFLTFNELGQFEYFPDADPLFSPEQNVFNTTDGRNFVIERGESFAMKINMKSHKNQNDINLAMSLLERKEPFYIWPNAGDESIFTYKFKPFRFQDIFKVAHVGAYGPKYTNNYYKSGLNTILNLIEVV